jgi:hypothetical protein
MMRRTMLLVALAALTVVILALTAGPTLAQGPHRCPPGTTPYFPPEGEAICLGSNSNSSSTHN